MYAHKVKEDLIREITGETNDPTDATLRKGNQDI